MIFALFSFRFGPSQTPGFPVNIFREVNILASLLTTFTKDSAIIQFFFYSSTLIRESKYIQITPKRKDEL